MSEAASQSTYHSGIRQKRSDPQYRNEGRRRAKSSSGSSGRIPCTPPRAPATPVASVRSRKRASAKPSGSAVPACRWGKGSWSSALDRVWKRGSRARSRWRRVVPVRPMPTMKTGRRRGSASISGWSRSSAARSTARRKESPRSQAAGATRAGAEPGDGVEQPVDGAPERLGRRLGAGVGERESLALGPLPASREEALGVETTLGEREPASGRDGRSTTRSTLSRGVSGPGQRSSAPRSASSAVASTGRVDLGAAGANHQRAMWSSSPQWACNGERSPRARQAVRNSSYDTFRRATPKSSGAKSKTPGSCSQQ